MTNLTNIQRDFTFAKLMDSDIDFGTEFEIGVESPTVNNSGVVNFDIGQLTSSADVTQTAGHGRSAGVLMNPPTVDRVPYRVKSRCKLPGNGGIETFVLIGYAPASPTGSDDVLTQARWFPTQDGLFDEIVLIDAIDTTDTEYGRAIYFGIATAGFVISASLTLGQISVQNLGVKPPTMQNACC